VLKEKKIFNLKDMNDIVYSDNKTQNTINQKSFVSKFLASIKQKMYNRTKK